MKVVARYLSVLTIALVSACGGGGQKPFPVESAYDTAVIQDLVNACTLTITVHRDGTAQSNSSCPSAVSKTTTLSQALVSPLFSDLQVAQPLNALVNCPTVDVSMSIAWDNQQSPSNIGTCTGASTAEQNLVHDISGIITSFTPVP